LYSVDVFFFVGGFLLAYGFLKEKDKIKSNSKYGLAILNRYLRIVPSYFIAIMIYYSVYPHLGNGPFWDQSL
jgi:peptidoglycan/LPS O-acetylase OafA/YrhL